MIKKALYITNKKYHVRKYGSLLVVKWKWIREGYLDT
jgi:hypothetical protein